jgi:hypothetical protein
MEPELYCRFVLDGVKMYAKFDGAYHSFSFELSRQQLLEMVQSGEQVLHDYAKQQESISDKERN